MLLHDSVVLFTYSYVLFIMLFVVYLFYFEDRGKVLHRHRVGHPPQRGVRQPSEGRKIWSETLIELKFVNSSFSSLSSHGT